MTDAAQKIADMIEAAEPQESTAPRSLGFSVHAINGKRSSDPTALTA
jgi:hypothetical protein